MIVKDSLYLSSDLVEVWLVKLERKKKIREMEMSKAEKATAISLQGK